MPTALQDHYDNMHHNSSKNLRGIPSGVNGRKLNSLSQKKQPYGGQGSRNGRMYERNVNNAKAYLGYQSSNRDRNGNIIPPVVLAANNHGRSALPSPNRGPEEQKRANSVASGDTIISTASSNSPLKGRRGKSNAGMGLAINGSAIPSTLQAQRGKYPGHKLARNSPYVKKGGALLRNQSNSRAA